jgi:glycosyltransferase involved in cell wall biosynthesis
VSDPLRIAVVARHVHRGESLPRLALDLVRTLAARGNELDLFTIAATCDRDLLPGVRVRAVPVEARDGARLGLAREISAFARASARMLERERARFDVVYTRMPATWVSDVLYVPGLVQGEIERYREGRGEAGPARRAKDALEPVVRPAIGVRRRLERRALAWPGLRLVQVYAPEIRDELLAAHPVGPDRVLVLPPGVSLDRFRPGGRATARAALGLPPDGLLVLFCGHGFERKGLDRALAALAAMREPARLLVAGRDDPEPWRRRAREAGVGERVTFTGPVPDPERLYAAADAVVFPSRADVWGAPIVEGMASGLPVVTSATAGAATLLEDGRTGIVLPAPLDPAALAAALDRLAADPGLRARLGAEAREAATPLSWDAHAARLEEAFHAVARSRDRAPARG